MDDLAQNEKGEEGCAGPQPNQKRNWRKDDGEKITVVEYFLNHIPKPSLRPKPRWQQTHPMTNVDNGWTI